MTNQLPVLTKRHIEKFYEATPDVRLINGCYNLVSCKVKCNKRVVEIRVEVTHPSLAWRCGDKNYVGIIDWETIHSGVHYNDIPGALEPLVEEMKVLGKMEDDVAEALSAKNKHLFKKYLNDMGIFLKP